ncbi:hypothetical protein PCANC_15703 [Puccinia coronata f. sp. avenae]|uniref:YCII-related domain-containing protein n=1 Tax=Puccinia coronata f. sp. avenae TaxID=200324 RepID=A0A2N5SNF1_9BASI|nr:hypothetical protein PCANC_15703 [Puccinia coronata f. sp. avenae]
MSISPIILRISRHASKRAFQANILSIDYGHRQTSSTASPRKEINTEIKWNSPLPRQQSSASPTRAMDGNGVVSTYLVIAPDLSNSNRLAIREEHLKMAQEGLKTGRIVNADAILDSDPSDANDFLPKMMGSWLLIKATSIEEARRLCLNDVYSTKSTWDVSKLQIMPVKTIV